MAFLLRAAGSALCTALSGCAAELQALSSFAAVRLPSQPQGRLPSTASTRTAAARTRARAMPPAGAGSACASASTRCIRPCRPCSRVRFLGAKARLPTASRAAARSLRAQSRAAAAGKLLATGPSAAVCTVAGQHIAAANCRGGPAPRRRPLQRQEQEAALWHSCESQPRPLPPRNKRSLTWARCRPRRPPRRCPAPAPPVQ